MAQQTHTYGAIGDVDGEEENNSGRRRSSVSLSKDEIGRALGRVSLTDISTRDVDADVDADADAKGIHGGVLYKLMSKVMSLVNILEFLPPILPAIFSHNLDLAVTIAFGIAIMNMVLEFIWYKLGGSRIAIRVMSTSFAISYGAMFFLTHYDSGGVDVDPSRRDLYMRTWFDAITYGGIFVCLSVASMFGQSFVRDVLADTMEEAQLTHPIIQHITKRMTALWIFAFFGMAMVGLVGAIRGTGDSDDDDDDRPPPSDLFVFAFQNSGFLGYVFLGIAVTGQVLYPKHLRNTLDEKMEFYKDEIDQWNLDHPDTELPVGM